MRRRLIAPGALATSIGVHALALGFGAWLLSRSFAEKNPPAAAPPPALEVSVEPGELALPEVKGEGFTASTEPTELEVDPFEVAGGGGHDRPRPDLERAGRGGSRESSPASNLSSSIDPLTLDRDPYTRDRSQVQRLHTSHERRTLDDRRATPTPMQLVLLASGSGRREERRSPSRFDPARGSRLGEQPTQVGSALGGAQQPDPGAGPEAPRGAATAGSERREIQAGVTNGGETRDYRRSAAVVMARPWVPQARPAVPAAQRGRQNDTIDSSQEVASRVASLIQASTAGGETGSGVGGVPRGGEPGSGGKSGPGSRSTAAGAGYGADVSSDPGLAGYHDSLLRRLDRELEHAFPKWAILEGRSGQVIFELTILKDGRVADVRIVRPSGIDEYDRNVLAGARRLGSVGPLPAKYGDRALIRVNRDALNLVVGRDGPGPGGRGK